MTYIDQKPKKTTFFPWDLRIVGYNTSLFLAQKNIYIKKKKQKL